ncbi:Hypothetical predicted protein [Paramuricea clavata]|uniref:Uncharacterized protein n=1 Tax=Paramuricea clavata TaxID=317549 RepID=A0A7D9JQH1_PARCT|nr:Hypothetical predicted protein [Paramuricea clavata]
MSKLVENACKEVKSGYKDLINQVRHIGNKFLSAVEISAQEAVYLTLQLPLQRSSRQVQFINTTIPNERTFLLKPMDKLQELPGNSEDNIIKSLDDFLPENDFEDNLDDDQNDAMSDKDINFIQDEYQLKGSYKLVKRSVSKVIRSVRYNKNKSPESYYREQLMLYMPWRNEDENLICACQTFEEKYEQLKDIILKNRSHCEVYSDVLEKAVEDLDNFLNVMIMVI